MDTPPHPQVPLMSLTTNDEYNRVPTNNESIKFYNDTVMEIVRLGIDTPIYLSEPIHKRGAYVFTLDY